MFIKRSNTVILNGDIAIGVEKREVIFVTGAMHNRIRLYNLTILEYNRPIFACAFYLQKTYTLLMGSHHSLIYIYLSFFCFVAILISTIE